MKLLLTSAGIKNPSIQDALVGLLGKPIAEASALCIPTASYGHPMAGPGAAWRFISGREPRCPMCELGWKSLGVLELTALPSIGEEPIRWKPPTGGDRALGLVDFSIFPHVDHKDMPDNSMASAEQWAAKLPVPGYAIDDQTAIKVTDGTVEVVSEGHWKLFSS